MFFHNKTIPAPPEFSLIKWRQQHTTTTTKKIKNGSDIYSIVKDLELGALQKAEEHVPIIWENSESFVAPCQCSIPAGENIMSPGFAIISLS